MHILHTHTISGMVSRVSCDAVQKRPEQRSWLDWGFGELFDPFFSLPSLGFDPQLSRRLPAPQPMKLDIKENASEFVIQADVPGANKVSANKEQMPWRPSTPVTQHPPTD